VAFSHGEQPAGRPWGATAKVRLHPVFWQVCGRPVCSVGGLQAREGPARKFKLKQHFSFLPAACSGGRRKRNSVVQNDTVLLFLFLFVFFECMKRRRFGENAPFQLNVAPERAKFQISPYSSFFFLQLHPCQFRSSPLLLAAFFTLVLGL